MLEFPPTSEIFAP